MKKMSFFEESVKALVSSMFNDYNDNWDHMRFGHLEPIENRGFRKRIGRILNRRGYYHLFTIQHLINNSQWIGKLEYLYNNLKSEEDKQLLIQVLAYRVLGHRKVRLPLNTKSYWKTLKSLEILCDQSDSIDPHFLHFILYKMNLNKINFPIEFYFTLGGILTDFIIKQYEYNKNGTIIKAELDDIVIDAGGCWGDTALFFANEVGENGKVFSFEFIPGNIEIFEKNVLLNQKLNCVIELIKNPLWKDSATKMYYKDNGPGSRVTLEKFKEMNGECNTLSIDDLVAQKGINKIDFIKMDIEGAETNALIGATNTIKSFRPKLAIALYHSVEDFERIPIFIKSIVPDYEFYFSHCSINAEESILFAKVK
jgi:FkbM family methyltransferase